MVDLTAARQEILRWGLEELNMGKSGNPARLLQRTQDVLSEN